MPTNRKMWLASHSIDASFAPGGILGRAGALAEACFSILVSRVSVSCLQTSIFFAEERRGRERWRRAGGNHSRRRRRRMAMSMPSSASSTRISSDTVLLAFFDPG